MYEIRTELDCTLIASGTKAEMEMVLAAFGKYGIRQDKFVLWTPNEWNDFNEADKWGR